MGLNVRQTRLDQVLKTMSTGQDNRVTSDLKASEVVFNRIQKEIKGSLGQIMKQVKEVNRDGRAIKDSHIRILEENM